MVAPFLTKDKDYENSKNTTALGKFSDDRGY